MNCKSHSLGVGVLFVACTLVELIDSVLDLTVVICVTDDWFSVGLTIKLCVSGSVKNGAKLVVMAGIIVKLELIKTCEWTITLFADAG